jgi:hypothetical protein
LIDVGPISSAVAFLGYECFVVTTAIEYPANFNVAAWQDHVDDDDAPLEAKNANTRTKIIAPSAAFGKDRQKLASLPDTADIADRPFRTATLLAM